MDGDVLGIISLITVSPLEMCKTKIGRLTSDVIEAIKSLFAHVYANFTTSIYSTGDMRPVDAYLSHPRGERVELMFHLLDDKNTNEG